MPCSIPATSVSSRHRAKSPSSPPRGMPTPSALLDLTKAGERRVEAFMRWAATGTSPLWLPLAVRRRKSAGLTQTELASAAKLSTTTIANLESGRNTPAALTVASLRNVTALKLGVALPQYAEPQSVAQR